MQCVSFRSDWMSELRISRHSHGLSHAERSIKLRAAKREPKVYSVYKRIAQVSGSRDRIDE